MSSSAAVPPVPAVRGPRARRWARPRRTGLGRALGFCALALAAAGAAVVGGAGSASAHDELISVTPADGSTVAAAPAAVVLVFGEPAVALGTEILVLGPDGAQVSVGPAVLADATVSQPLLDVRPAGAYMVQWRVTSADGHPISGELAFTASTPVPPPAATPAPSDRPTASDAPAASASPTAPASATPSGSAPPQQAGPDDDGSILPWLIGGGAAALALGAGAVWWVRRDQGQGESSVESSGKGQGEA